MAHDIDHKTVSPLVALKELGHNTRKPCSGHVLVQIDTFIIKTYRFQHRSGDGRVRCRLGRLVAAYKQPGSGLWIFQLDN